VSDAEVTAERIRYKSGKLGADLATVGRTADDVGFDFVAVMDQSIPRTSS